MHPNIFFRLTHHFLVYPLFIRVAVVMVFTCISVFIITNLIIFFKRVFDALWNARLSKARRIVANELTENFMVSDDMQETDIDRLIRRLSRLSLINRVFSQVIIDELIFFHHNFTGRIGRILRRVYRKLNMVDRSIRKIRSSSWSTKAKGLRELQEMPPGEQGLRLITPLLNDKNPDLRVEAQAAYIRFDPEEPFKFLGMATRELSEWHQIILFELAITTEGLVVPEFKKWFDSPNTSVICFCIKMVIHYQQMDAADDLEKLLEHPEKKIRESAIHALGKLDMAQAEEKLKKMYSIADIPIRIKILEALGLIAGNHNIDFLKYQFLHAEDFALIKSAGCALASHHRFDDPDAFAEQALPPLQLSVMHHCTNSLIRN